MTPNSIRPPLFLHYFFRLLSSNIPFLHQSLNFTFKFFPFILRSRFVPEFIVNLPTIKCLFVTLLHFIGVKVSWRYRPP
jgi:hypothetical protein